MRNGTTDEGGGTEAEAGEKRGRVAEKTQRADRSAESARTRGLPSPRHHSHEDCRACRSTHDDKRLRAVFAPRVQILMI